MGSQRPRVESIPDGFVSDKVEFAFEMFEVVGLKLDPWQKYVVSNSLRFRENSEKFAAFEAAVIVPRQNGKGEILLARQLAGLFAFNEKLIMHSAHEYKTAAEAFLRIKTLIENSDLIKLCKKPRVANGEQGIELLNGNRLRFVARSHGSGRGFSADCVIMDEAYALGPDEMAAMLPTLISRENPQIWYASSAGMDSSSQLKAIRERGMSENPGRLAYFEWSVDRRADFNDPDNWAVANPALGIRIEEDGVASERATLPDAEFGRERLGIWDDSAAQAVIPFEVWDRALDRRSAPLDPVTFAFDIAPDRSSSTVALVGRRDDGDWHAEVVKSAPGTAWLAGAMVDLQAKWSPTGFWCDPAGPGGSMLPALAEAGVDVQQVTMRQVTQACGAFFDAVMTGHLHHRDQPELTAAVRGARQRPLGDAWAWNRKDATTDIHPLVAVTLAMLGSGEAAAKPKRTTRGRVFVLDD